MSVATPRAPPTRAAPATCTSGAAQRLWSSRIQPASTSAAPSWRTCRTIVESGSTRRHLSIAGRQRLAGCARRCSHFDRDVTGVARKLPAEGTNRSRACGGPTQEIRITERDVAGTSGDVPPDVLEDDLDQDDPEPALRRPARSGTAGTGACSPGLPACRSPLDVRVRAEPPRAWRAARRSRTGTRNVKRVPLRAVARRNLSRLRAAGGD